MYHYTECGLPNVWLINGYKQKKTPYGESVSFFDIKGLHKTIGGIIVSKQGILAPDEIRFLRKELGWTQAELAKKLGVKEITVRKWEGKGKETINNPADRLLKILYKEITDPNSLSKDLIALIDELSKLDIDKIAQQSLPPINFKKWKNQWKTTIQGNLGQ